MIPALPSSQQEISITEQNEGLRLDIFLARALSERFSRAQLQRHIKGGQVLVSGNQVAPHYRLKKGDLIRLEWTQTPRDETRAEDIPLEIIFEDEDLILVNKPAGMVVHPACGNPHHTLVNALLYHTKKNLSGLGGAVRPGIVHRLDKDTSGIMVIAKNDRAHALLAKQFKNQTIERIYRVIVRGAVQHDQGICEEPVGRAFLNRKKVVIKPSGGKDAVTHYRVLKRCRNATLLEVRPQTGRTHQIRVHMSHIGHPVLGDAFYGVTHPLILRQAVHAFALGLTHPRTKEKIYYETSLPEDMSQLLAHMGAEK